MPMLYILDTEWPTGEVKNTDTAVRVNDFSEAVRILESDLEKTATVEFKMKVMREFWNHRFVHVPNGKEPAGNGVMVLYIPDSL
jgi:hypothetical protein